MKAIVQHEYGAPDVLACAEIAKPVPRAGEVLIRVRAASVNPIDWHFMRGTPLFLRIMAGLRKPKRIRLGFDVAGEVEAAGAKVPGLKPGDAVFGACRGGAFAEYACAPASAVILKPDALSFEEAASAPVSALTALQAIRRKKRSIAPGDKILINGAAGGVGTFAVQIAKSFGMEVTGVCSTAKADMVRSLGADRVIDYTQEDFTRRRDRYDLILDCIGNHSLAVFRRLLTRDGTYVSIGAPSGRWMIGAFARAFWSPVLSLFIRQKLVTIVGKPSWEDLALIRDWMIAGKLKPVIGRRYNLSETAEAIRYVEEGHARGKVIIAIPA